MYLQACKDLDVDWLLILDSDEYVSIDGDFRLSAETMLDTANNHYIYDVMSMRTETDYLKYDPRPRLWYEPWDMRYKECHCCYGRIDGKIRLNERPCIEGITINHDHELRTVKRTAEWKQFVQYQLQAENQDGAVM